MSVLSKLVELTTEKSKSDGKILSPKISQGLMGAVACVYLCKLGYPTIKKFLATTAPSSLKGETLNKSVHANDADDNDDDATNNNRTLNGKILRRRNAPKNEQTRRKPTNGDDNDDDEDEQLRVAEAEKVLVNSLREKQRKNSPGKDDSSRAGVNGEFFRQLKRLRTIMIPRLVCHETGLLAVHTTCLISRTFLSIYVASLEGAIVKFIVRKDSRMFLLLLLKWFGIAIPATFINSMIRYLENKLALAFRTRLVRHSYGLYFKNQNYYRVSNLDGRIENADHRLTEDISVFTSSVAHLYSHLTKPCFDLMLIGLALMRSSRKMKANIVTGPLFAVTVISLTAHILRIVSPKFGQLVAEEANRYGYLRHVHSRIITNAEEIAFYDGHKVELKQLREAYNRLVSQMNVIFSKKLWFVMLEQFFMKYVWSGTGMVMVSLPILTSSIVETSEIGGNNSTAGSHASERTQYLTTARNLLISAADAIERLMSSYKEIVALAGYTQRVAGLLDVLEETAQGIYRRQTVASATVQQNTDFQKETTLFSRANIQFDEWGQPIPNGRIIFTQNTNDMSISLHNVPVITPNCDIVVPSLTLSIAPGMHLLITGPNGCGKSSLFRILSGLWPLYGGELHIPQRQDGKPCMFYIPQRPYMSIGSLCDQIIYPDTRQDMQRNNVTEKQLRDVLKMVALEHIAVRDSFDTVRDWKDILSGGEKQRMAIARLFYHKPKYALLDECTSAVSIDIESYIYETAKNMGITLLTITHRPTLWKFHTHILEFDGQGGWNFKTLNTDVKQQN